MSLSFTKSVPIHFHSSKGGGSTVDKRDHMMKYMTHQRSEFEKHLDTQRNVEVMVLSVFSGMTNKIVNALDRLYEIDTRQGYQEISTLIEKEFEEVRHAIFEKIDDMFDITQPFCDFLGWDSPEALSEDQVQLVVDARKSAYEWEKQVFERRLEQLTAHAMVRGLLGDVVEFRKNDLENLAIGYGEDVVVGVYKELYGLHPQIEAVALPKYTKVTEGNHTQRYSIEELCLREKPNDRDFYNNIIDELKETLQEVVKSPSKDSIDALLEGTKMQVILVSGWTGDIGTSKRSYSDLKAALASIALARLQRGSAVQKKMVLTLLKDFALLKSCNPTQLSSAEEAGELVATPQDIKKISFIIAALLSMANNDNTPVAAAVSNVMMEYNLKAAEDEEAIPVEMETRNIEQPEAQGTVFLLDVEGDRTLLSVIPEDREVAIKVSGIAESDQEGFVSTVANFFRRNGISIFDSNSATSAVQFSVTLSNDERIRASQKAKIEKMLNELHEHYSRGHVGNGNGAVKMFTGRPRLTLIGEAVRNNPWILSEVSTVLREYGYSINTLSKVNDENNFSFQVEYVGEGRPSIKAQDVIHRYFIEKLGAEKIASA